MRGVVEDVPVFITGYGELRALDILSIAPEVSGKTVKINSGLEVGKVIYKGALLFKIDSRNYLSAEKQEMAIVGQWKDTILRLKKEFAIKKNRLKIKQVTMARIDGKNTFISAGISPGKIPITTRLIEPLEHSLLKITKTCESSDYFLDLPKGSE